LGANRSLSRESRRIPEPPSGHDTDSVPPTALDPPFARVSVAGRKLPHRFLEGGRRTRNVRSVHYRPVPTSRPRAGGGGVAGARYGPRKRNHTAEGGGGQVQPIITSAASFRGDYCCGLAPRKKHWKRALHLHEFRQGARSATGRSAPCQ